MATEPEAPRAKAFSAISATATPTDRRVTLRVARSASSEAVVVIAALSRKASTAPRVACGCGVSGIVMKWPHGGLAMGLGPGLSEATCSRK